MRWTGIGKIERERSGRRYGIQCGEAGDPVIAVVEVLLAEEDGGRIVTAHHVGPQPPDPADKFSPEFVRVHQLPVRMTQVCHALQADHLRGLVQFCRSHSRHDNPIPTAALVGSIPSAYTISAARPISQPIATT